MAINVPQVLLLSHASRRVEGDEVCVRGWFRFVVLGRGILLARRNKIVDFHPVFVNILGDESSIKTFDGDWWPTRDS